MIESGFSYLISLLHDLADHIHRLDPLNFANHSLEKEPFFEPVPGMPHFNAMFAYLWFRGFCRLVNMSHYLSPSGSETLDVLFERKIPNSDGTPSQHYVINENLMALLHFLVECSTDASASLRRAKRTRFTQQLALYKAMVEKGVDWRGKLLALLKLWWPDFKGSLERKRCSSVKDFNELVAAHQVDPRLL